MIKRAAPLGARPLTAVNSLLTQIEPLQFRVYHCVCCVIAEKGGGQFARGTARVPVLLVVERAEAQHREIIR